MAVLWFLATSTDENEEEDSSTGAFQTRPRKSRSTGKYLGAELLHCA